jgi:sulfatase maturation enzyme AslB (radical SAM superfamily)
MKFQYKDEYKYPTHIMLNVTDACNLACRYCFVEQHPHYMTLDIAKKAVDWTYKNYMIKKSKKLLLYKDEKPDINFFGGEPMLMYNSIIVPLIEYIEKKYPNIFTFGMTTNCTLLTQESIDFFYEHRMGHILCSIDGAEKTQCYNRPCKNGDNSSKLIEKNIKYLLEKFP